MENKLYEESIILIGPSGAGKTSVSKKLRKMLNVPSICLDAISNKLRTRKICDKYKTADEFNYFIMSETAKFLKTKNRRIIIDCGANHSVYDDDKIFEKVKQEYADFKNIVLLLPCKDEDKALKIMSKRATGCDGENQRLLKSICNKQLATIIVYDNKRRPTEIAREIISLIEERKIEEEYQNMSER